MRLKPDFERTLQRFEAWWLGEMVDRPPVVLHTRLRQPVQWPRKPHASLRDRWMDAEFQVEFGLASLRAQAYPGDRLPIWFPNLGPELTATLLGCDLEFSEETSWSHPTVHDLSDWSRIAALEPDFDNPYWRTVERMTDLAIGAFAGEALVGITDLHGNYDILAALRDPQALCLDLLDDPAAPQSALDAAVKCFVAGFERLYTKLEAVGQPSVSWLPTPHAGPGYIPSCDFWCMVSPAMGRDLILPGILAEMAPMQRNIFHLDGPHALPHLDTLLELPNLHALQWQYGAGKGPASNWIEVYRRCRAAGKSVLVHAYDAEDALGVLDAVGPRGVMFMIDKTFTDAADADSFLREVERRSAP